MFCQSCNVEIPAAWAKAIASNQCPACGEAIVSEDNKKLMEALKEAIEKMAASPVELASWLIATFDLTPKGAIQPTVFHRGNRPAQPGQAPVSSQLVWANSATHDFLKRAKVDKVANNPKLNRIAQVLNEVEEEQYGHDEEISIEDEEADEREQMILVAQQARRSGKKLRKADLLANVSNFNLGYDAGPPLNQYEEATLQNVMGGNQEQEDMALLPPALQIDRMKRLAKQQEVASGGVGFIKRMS